MSLAYAEQKSFPKESAKKITSSKTYQSKTYEQGYEAGYKKAYAEIEKDRNIYLKNINSFDALYAKA